MHRPQEVSWVYTQILADPSPLPSSLITTRSTLQTYNRFYSPTRLAFVSHVNGLPQKYQKLLELGLLNPRQHSPGENTLSPCLLVLAASQCHCPTPTVLGGVRGKVYPQVQRRQRSWVALPDKLPCSQKSGHKFSARFSSAEMFLFWEGTG